MGTLNLLVAARDAKVKRVVYAASSSAYGDTPTLPKHEEMSPNPISPYATAKLTGEYYMTNFYRCYGLETVCLRYFNVFGPRQDPTSPYSGVLRQAGDVGEHGRVAFGGLCVAGFARHGDSELGAHVAAVAGCASARIESICATVPLEHLVHVHVEGNLEGFGVGELALDRHSRPSLLDRLEPHGER